MKEITFKKGDVIFREKDFSTVMYDILAGKVGIFKDYQGKTQSKIAELEAGQVLGEMGVLEYYPRSATAVALEDGTVLTEISENEIREYFKDKPEKLLPIMKQLSRRIRETTEKYLQLCQAMREHEGTADLERLLELRQQMAILENNYFADFMF